jgi:acetate kinase
MEAMTRVLVVNAGSSSLKLGVLGDGDEPLSSRELRLGGGTSPEDALAAFLEGAPPIDAAGHRVVHGGSEFTAPTRVDADAEARLARLADLAPLHNPPALRSIRALAALRPDMPQVACFDTSFHAGLPEEAAAYALPEDWRERWGLRRFGFHGLSHAHAARRAAGLVGREDLRVVTCHLGAGASLAAVRGGRSVDTTMGFTPLEGLVMATRSGSVDPGLLLWLQRHAGVDAETLEDALERRSGLLGLTGTADMREVLARAAKGDAAAAAGLGVYLHRLRAGIAAMAAAMDGLDALVFTAGVGERSPEVRARACAGLAFLGVDLDPGRNAAAAGDADVSAAGAAVRTLVVEAREDLEIARQVRAVLRSSGPPGDGSPGDRGPQATSSTDP